VVLWKRAWKIWHASLVESEGEGQKKWQWVEWLGGEGRCSIERRRWQRPIQQNFVAPRLPLAAMLVVEVPVQIAFVVVVGEGFVAVAWVVAAWVVAAWVVAAWVVAAWVVAARNEVASRVVATQ
jgi:hypothetical protein